MSAGNWLVLGLTGDPVRGNPGAVRALAKASQEEAKRWEVQIQSLRAIADEGDAMAMEGGLAPVARQTLQAHLDDAEPLARWPAEVGTALLAYARQLERARNQSQQALRQGEQAKRTFDRAKRTYDQTVAQMDAMPRVAPHMLAHDRQRYYRLRTQAQRAWQNMSQADTQLKAAQRLAQQAGEQAAQQERIAADKVMAAAPTRRPAT